jgi:cytochrome d ubiquinol oxidase subunit II
LTAGGGERGAEVRTLIDRRIGPVWEANHVWLIYVLVMWWTGFPAAFAAVTTTLFIPFMLALAGIVLRRASFAFRKFAATFGQARLFGAVVAGSSLITPFFLGTVAGAIASGRVPAHPHHRRRTCLRPHRVRGSISRRARRPTLSHGLLGRALPLLVVAALAGAVTLVLLYRRRSAVVIHHRRFPSARIFAATAVAAVVAGLGVGQHPWMFVDHMTIADAAGATTTLAALLVVVVLAAVTVVPALSYLLWFTQTERTAMS